MLADPGRILGKYQLIAEIARGGMGVVFLAMVQGPGGFNKLVVVKELKPELVEEPAFLTMFLDEARLAARLSHPNIVQTNEVGNDGDRYFMAMDYLDGRGLDQVRRRSKTAGFGLSVPMQLRVICDMLAGLDYAHKLTDFDGSPLNIVHRDVSPQNVFVTFDGQIKLLDFGIAKAANSMHETHAGVVKGKVSYMSPEQGRGWRVDARADVFSAGVMLWEALTGKRMREGKNDQEKLWALVSAEVPRASTIKPWVPPALDDICARAMAWNRDERYPSAGAMQHDLESYLTTTGTSVSTREVGACVTELFREDRASTHAVIEAYVARARRGAVRDKLPVIDVASRVGLGSPTPSGQHEVPREPTEPGLVTSLDSPSARSGTAAGAASDPRRGESRLRSLKGVIIAGAAGVVIAVAVIVVIARATGGAVALSSRADSAPRTTASLTVPAPVPAAAPASGLAAINPGSPGNLTNTTNATSATGPGSATGAAAEPSEPARPAAVGVEIRVSPATATISIDGKGVDGNPFESQYPSDDLVHNVRATAPGHVTKSVAVTFDKKVQLDLILERILPDPAPARPPARAQVRAAPPPPRVAQPPRPPEPRPAEVRPPEPTPAPEPAARPPEPSTKPQVPPTYVDPAGGIKQPRPIDPNNPYGGVK
jgi:eukaryotic-like serine/threonine-protein kinase